MSELSDKVLERIYKEALADVDKKATYIQALETELEQSDEQVQMQLIELQKLKEFVRHKKDCPDDEEGSFGCCTCGLDELLNQSEG